MCHTEKGCCKRCQQHREDSSLSFEAMDNDQRRIRIAELTTVQEELLKLVRTCPHDFIPEGTVFHGYNGDIQLAKCTICGKTDRWYCEKSPSKKCVYDSAHGDYCIYCGRRYDLPK